MTRTLLPFLYPRLSRVSPRIHRAAPVLSASFRASLSRSLASSRNAYLHTSTARLAVRERHGKAVEPIAGDSPTKAKDSKKLPKEENSKPDTPRRDDTREKESEEIRLPAPDASESSSATFQQIFDDKVRRALAPDSVLHIDQVAIPFDNPNTQSPPRNPPKEGKEERTKDILDLAIASPAPDPLLVASDVPTQHFDTFALVSALKEGGFTKNQSIAVMKVLHALLTHHMLVSRKELVAKSDIDNSVYLFRAAVSELKMEIQRSRNTMVEKIRSDRGTLQNEQDQLNQRLQQDLARLKDDLASMFNDRKILVEQELRDMHSRVQNLNLKITRSFGADIKGEVEGLRWILTRRGIGAILIAGFSILFGLRNYASHAREERAESKEKEKEAKALPLDNIADQVEGTEADAVAIASTG